VSKLLAILGSPRKGGNTDTLLEKAIDAFRRTKASFRKIILNDLSIKPCQECDGCAGTGACVINDDMALIYKALDDSDAVIVASPIYFGNVSAQTKIMIDRMQCFWVRKYKLLKISNKKRKGGFIACGGNKLDDFFKCAEKVVNIFFKVQDIEFIEGLFAGGVDDKGDISKYKDALENAYRLGEKLI